MTTGYPIQGLKTALQKSLDFIAVIEQCGYSNVDGSCSCFRFEKTIDKDRYFMLTVTNQLSGYARADLSYYRKDKEKKEEYLCCDASELVKRINTIEAQIIMFG